MVFISLANLPLKPTPEVLTHHSPKHYTCDHYQQWDGLVQPWNIVNLGGAEDLVCDHPSLLGRADNKTLGLIEVPHDPGDHSALRPIPSGIIQTRADLVRYSHSM